MRNGTPEYKTMPDGMEIIYPAFYKKINARSITEAAGNDPSNNRKGYMVPGRFYDKYDHPAHYQVYKQRNVMKPVGEKQFKYHANPHQPPHDRQKNDSGCFGQIPDNKGRISAGNEEINAHVIHPLQKILHPLMLHRVVQRGTRVHHQHACTKSKYAPKNRHGMVLVGIHQ